MKFEGQSANERTDKRVSKLRGLALGVLTAMPGAVSANEDNQNFEQFPELPRVELQDVGPDDYGEHVQSLKENSQFILALASSVISGIEQGQIESRNHIQDIEEKFDVLMQNLMNANLMAVAASAIDSNPDNQAQLSEISTAFMSAITTKDIALGMLAEKMRELPEEHEL